MRDYIEVMEIVKTEGYRYTSTELGLSVLSKSSPTLGYITINKGFDCIEGFTEDQFIAYVKEDKETAELYGYRDYYKRLNDDTAGDNAEQLAHEQLLKDHNI
jgi:hypothetical protein